MQTTGSRTLFPTRSMAVRITLLAVVAAFSLGALSLFLTQASAGPPAVTVNSTSNTDDGDCEGTPNAGVGNCTLVEAINDVNAGLGSPTLTKRSSTT